MPQRLVRNATYLVMIQVGTLNNFVRMHVLYSSIIEFDAVLSNIQLRWSALDNWNNSIEISVHGHCPQIQRIFVRLLFLQTIRMFQDPQAEQHPPITTTRFRAGARIGKFLLRFGAFDWTWINWFGHFRFHN